MESFSPHPRENEFAMVLDRTRKKIQTELEEQARHFEKTVLSRSVSAILKIFEEEHLGSPSFHVELELPLCVDKEACLETLRSNFKVSEKEIFSLGEVIQISWRDRRSIFHQIMESLREDLLPDPPC